MVSRSADRQITEKQEDHQADETRGERRLPQNAENGGLHENGLIADSLNGQPGRQAFLDPRQQRLDPVDDSESRRGARFQDRHQHRARPIDANDVGLRRRPLMHVGDVANENGRPIDVFQRKVVEPVEQNRTGVKGDAPVKFANFCVSSRQN
jgi:hypothetical protein